MEETRIKNRLEKSARYLERVWLRPHFSRVSSRPECSDWVEISVIIKLVLMIRFIIPVKQLQIMITG